IATQSNVFSATKTGISVSSLITALKFFNNAPPPERTIPLSIISADNSGGVFSNVTFIASTIFSTSSSKAVVISLDVIVIVLGKPVKRSRPRISISSISSTGLAEPITCLISSAVLSPIIILYSFRMYLVIDESKSLPAVLIDLLVTIPPKEITATSVVPPPISTIILPVGSHTGKSDPIAAAKGSAIVKASFAPACLAASTTALSSTFVIPVGTQITTLGLLEKAERFLRAAFRK